MAHTDDQTVLSDKTFVPQVHPKPSLADLLTVETSVSIFYSYARELQLSSLLSDGQAAVSIFAPTNRAVMALARKPHQGPAEPDEGIQINDDEYEKMSRENVKRWVSAHMIPESPIDLGSAESHPTLLEGKNISFTPISKNDGQGPMWRRVTLEGGVKILQMKEASNGVLYVIDGTVAPA
ncbi:hypothetical protein M378DRAFT_154755 [Amanita muscaria Koide BX008]|uniref:FAS1 domain-containing protein n=1 Tax=Amanita muscaria (strain Koide BX008) TaxID=946122 RepID=A0A0C2XPV8_AMAMK|nr:hypothetical protein M378DRAFT_154755 [Amanita muscaria Koide BX008]